jgi:hypothetical protein
VRDNLRRTLVGFAAGLFQGPAFLWGQFAPLVGASTGEAAWVRWSPLGLMLALVFGLLVLAGDRVGARPLILTVCTATLAGAVLLAVGGAGAEHARAFALVAVIGSFVQFAATRTGVLVSAHETRGLDADQQLSQSRGLRRWFVIGIYAPSFAAGLLAARYGWVSVYGALSGLYSLALVVLWRWLRTDPSTRRPATRVPLSEAARAGARDPLLVLAALAALFAQAIVFGTVQALPTLLHGYHVSTGAVGYLQGAAIAAALLVARPKRLPHASFGRLVPVVALIGATTAGSLVWLSHGEHTQTVLASVAAGAALTFITMELLKQWSQSIAQVQARQHAAAEHDYVRQALWLLLANVGALVGALWISKLAATSPARWLLAISVAATLFLATTLAWYETHHRIHGHHGQHRTHTPRHRRSS